MTRNLEPTENQGIIWDLSDLYLSPNDPAWTDDSHRALERAKEFQAEYRKMDVPGMDAPGLFQALKEYESIQEGGLKPLLYASLLFSEDTQNQQYKTLLQKAKEQWNELENQLLFFRLGLMGLPEEALKKSLEYVPLQKYGHALDFLRRFRPFTRNEREEEIINRKNLTGRSAFTNLFDEFTGSFIFRFEMEGEEKELTGSQMLALLYSPDQSLRERAFRTFLQRHGENQIVLASILNALVLDSQVEDDMRGYPGPMHRTNLENEIPAETVEIMMEVTESHYFLAQEYFQVKACLLGYPRLKNSDIYAPLPGGKKEIPPEEARDLLLRSFQEFHPRFGEIAREFFTQRWIDAPARKGKYGGAFCSGMTPSLHPYILLNYTGHLRDALTLAHEMGHGIHFYLARQQTLMNFDPPLTLAETASVFGELIMTHALLREERNLAVRQALLCAEIEDMIATVFRQNVLTRFEQEIYRHRRHHLLSSEEIGDLWWQANAKLFGDHVETIAEYRWGWSYISHFIHSRFYCYSYIFGELVSLALYEKYEEEGASFLPHFIHLLERGGSGSPGTLLKDVGVNIERADFWEKGFQVIRQLIDELKSLGPWDKICTDPTS
jgi:oligoendopeptidase F